ncbi:MAG: type II secretion system protein [Oscillospiraceae bacterium]|nr:type II secretion system protein [Oscillospiraceae bacterium]
MKQNIASRKGVSIVEVVVALVIITIISASALSMMMMSVKVERSALTAMEVENAAEDAVDCFRFAKNDNAAFLECLQKTGEFVEEDGCFVMRGPAYTVTITSGTNQFEYSAVSTSGEEICAFTYKRGGGAG